MSTAPYNAIAEWYNHYLLDNPIYQDMVRPHLLQLIGDVQDQAMCDFACGQGWFSRELARRGARVTGIDIADGLLTLARQYEQQEPLGIVYRLDDAQSATSLADSSFDECVCVLALMDIPDLQATLQTMRRILKTGGRLTFALTHPCFELPHAQWRTTDEGQIVRAVSGYFNEGFWKSEGGGVRSRVGAYHRMLSTYLNTLITSGFSLERMIEPMATDERLQQVPGNREVPSLVLIQARAVNL